MTKPKPSCLGAAGSGASVSNRLVCPSRLLRWTVEAWSKASSRTLNILARVRPMESKAPTLISPSSTRLLTFCESMRQQKSIKEENGPSLSRDSKITSTAFPPTFLIATNPNRIPSGTTLKFFKLWFASGGRMWTPNSRHSVK